jgi:hypothetical protein
MFILKGLHRGAGASLERRKESEVDLRTVCEMGRNDQAVEVVTLGFRAAGWVLKEISAKSTDQRTAALKREEIRKQNYERKLLINFIKTINLR